MCYMADYTGAGKCDLAMFPACRREMFVVHLTFFAIVKQAWYSYTFCFVIHFFLVVSLIQMFVEKLFLQNVNNCSLVLDLCVTGMQKKSLIHVKDLSVII